MKTFTITEYYLLCLKHMTLKDIAIGLSLLCALILIVELLEVGIKALLLCGILLAFYKLVSILVTLIASVFTSQQQEVVVL